MRSDSRSRAGASFLGLLLLLHLGSGLLHPCCLGGAHAAEDASASHDGHGAMGALADGAGTAPSHHGTTSHSPDGEQDDDCDGACGLCCSTVDQIVLGSVVRADVALHDAINVERTRLHAVVLPPTPAFLLPFANAPPGSSPRAS